jgi:hypothetical protein
MAEELPNLFDAVRKANRAVWEQASGRKPSDESRAIPPPTGRESPLEGADASAMVAVLSAKLSALQARVDYIEDDFPDSEIGGGDGGGSTEDYAFKVTAVMNQNKTFTVNVLGGTAQTLGGTPYIYDDEELVNVEEGWHIYVVYKNLDPSYTEHGEWMQGIKASSAAVMANYTAPHDLVFEIGRISKEYIGNVRQDHKGNIVMPAISNVVDIQTQLP